MEEKYYEILRHYVNPNDCATVVKQLLSLHSVSNPLPTKEEVIAEGNKQIKDWVMDNSFEERTAYRIGFRRSFEYVLRFIK
jgi:hypothetical protein